MRDLIHRERRVELAFETHRFFDTRRWLIGEEKNGQPFYGMNIFATSDDPGSEVWQRTHPEDRVIEQRHHLFPIPQAERDRNQELVPNPYWKKIGTKAGCRARATFMVNTQQNR